MVTKIRTHGDLEVYQMAFKVAMEIFELSKRFPAEEKYALTDQVRRSSRSVCSNLGEGWRKRRYEKAFQLKLNDAEAEANETQVWLEFAVACNYLKPEETRNLYQTYNNIIGKLVNMINAPQKWTITK